MSATELTKPIVLERVNEIRQAIRAARGNGNRIGCVPTMGALHEGHLSLIRQARSDCDYVVVTNFVNPTQFGPNEDFEEYPRTFDQDYAACYNEGVDVIFHPDVETMYPPGDCTIVEVEGLSAVLEGKHRPGHFRGVTTVVTKLLHLVAPDIAYFGQKDYQQQLIIRQMCRDLLIPVEIRTCPIVREPDGLALSSRNQYLNAEERERALVLSQSLLLAEKRILAGERDLSIVREAMLDHLVSQPDVHVDYATVCDAETLEELAQPRPNMVALVAAKVGTTRLIDNLLIRL